MLYFPSPRPSEERKREEDPFKAVVSMPQHHRPRLIAELLGAVAVVTTFAVSAAADDAVERARDGVRALGKNFNGQVNAATQALYLELHRQADRSGVHAVANLDYGPHALQAMDIVVPDTDSDVPMPVVVYLHGGGLVRGDKVGADTDGLIYSNIPTFFARHGVIGLNANYRLVPEVEWPSGPEDVKAMLVWVRAHIEEYGGDPNAVFLMGNSAGSTHVAAYLFDETTHFDEGSGIAGAILSSGAFAAGDSEAALAYYGEDANLREARSPLGLVESYRGPEIPILMWSAEFDPTFIEVPVAAMYSKLCVKFENCPGFTQWQGHNHVSHVMSINTADDAVGLAVLDFIRSAR